MKLTQDHWKSWGFLGNPFDTKALSVYSKPLNISKAFVGRSMETNESKSLLNLIRNPGGGCVIVEGDIGVGKTTLVNYHRYLWEYEAEDKILSTVREIPVYSNWEAKDFLIEILGHLTNRLLKVFEKRKLSPGVLLQKLQTFNQIFYQESIEGQASFMGSGLGYAKKTQFNTPSISESQLVLYIEELLIEIKQIGYKGVILHFDNLELLTHQEVQKCQYLFEQIRDILQLPDIYYIFVCKTGFFSQAISPSERVRSIMGWPIKVPPLTCAQVIEAINIRYELLSIKRGKGIKLITDSYVRKLYQLYSGKIRFIMDSITQLGLQYSHNPHTLSEEEAEKAIIDIVKLKTNQLSKKEYEILIFMVGLKEEFTNDSIAKKTGMQPQNVSKILKRLLQENLIYHTRKEDNSIFYRTLEQLNLLVKQPKNKKPRISQKIRNRLDTLEKYLETHSQITSLEYKNMVNVSSNTARSDIGVLINRGLLEKQGNKKGTYYSKVAMEK